MPEQKKWITMVNKYGEKTEVPEDKLELFYKIQKEMRDLAVKTADGVGAEFFEWEMAEDET